MNNNHDNHACTHSQQANPYTQSLEELDFSKSIHQACLQGDLSKVKAHITKKGSRVVNERDTAGYTPLVLPVFVRHHYGARSGHEEICKLLLENGADPNATTPELLSTVSTSRQRFSRPLSRAAAGNHIKVVTLLLRHGANPKLVDSGGQSPLHKACENSSIAVAKLLIEQDRGLIGVKDNRGRGPLDCCRSKDDEVVLMNALQL
ncbi:10590_t:CDS:2 [Ambispora leptoticha]|uniref:10590_t:CDS:1 n=1 Tax=Ambispora leptoticha TaxID=144679 RepID=A0A9N9FFL1_9GLOM|nr:10590_t:CDS:2 [Ambispora leptoticha]